MASLGALLTLPSYIGIKSSATKQIMLEVNQDDIFIAISFFTFHMLPDFFYQYYYSNGLWISFIIVWLS